MGERTWKRTPPLALWLVLAAVMVGALWAIGGDSRVAEADAGDFSIDFVGAEPSSYDHTTGGGAYGSRTIGVEVVESLEGGDWSCGEIVTHFAAISVDDVASADTDAPQTIELDFSFTADSTGQSGVALGDVVFVGVNGPDNAGNNDGNSTASLLSEALTGPLFQSGSELHATVQVDDLERDELVVVRIDVRLFCELGSSPTGNLQSRLDAARLTFINGDQPVEPPDAIAGGAQTIPFKQVNQISFPEIDLVKTGSLDLGADGMATPGDLITYTLTVTNTGDSELNFVTLDDPLIDIGPLSDNGGDGIGTLAGGAVETATGTYAITQADIDAGVVNNTASVEGMDGGGIGVSDEDSHSEPIPQVAAIEVVKSGSIDLGADGVASPGDVITYTLTVTNTGNLELDNVSLSDPTVTLGPLSDNAGDGIDVLGPGDSESATGTYVITQEDIDNGGVLNTALVTGTTVVGDTPVDDDDSHEEPLASGASIDLVKTGSIDLGADNEPTPGDLITYTLTVTNTGNVTLDNVDLSDPLITIGALSDNAGDGVDVLAPGDTETASGSYAITQGDIDSGSVLNTALATGDPPAGEPVSDEDSHEQPVTGNPPPPAPPPVVATGRIVIQKVVQSFDGGVADNPADPALSGFDFEVRRSGGTLIGTFSSDGAGVASTGAIGLGDYVIIEVDDQGLTDVTQELEVTVGAGVIEVTWINRQLASDAPAIDIELATNGEDADTPEVAVGVEPGAALIWTYVVTNTGNIALTDVTVIDDNGTGDPADDQTVASGVTLAIGESQSFTAAGTAEEGLFGRRATATAAEGVSDTDPTWWEAEPAPGETEPIAETVFEVDIELATNGVDADLPEDAVNVSTGAAITWTYVITNLTDAALTDVVVIDDNGTPGDTSDDIVVVSGIDLPAGASRTFSGNGVAVAGIFGKSAEVLTAEGVTDVDPSHYNAGPGGLPNTGSGGLAATESGGAWWSALVAAAIAAAGALLVKRALQRRHGRDT